MNTTAPDLSGLVPFIIAFMVVAALGAVLTLAVIAHAAATVLLARRRARGAMPERVVAEGPVPALMDALPSRKAESHGSIEVESSRSAA